MFLYRVRLFSLFGFDVYVDASWLLLAVLITWSLAVGVFPTMAPGRSLAIYLWMGAAAAVGLLMSIVLHETAHSLVARRFQMPIKGITLFLFGGVAEMESEPTSAKAEFLMAAVGPLTSAILGFLLAMFGSVIVAAGGPATFAAVLNYLGGLNWVLALFNIVPAFPLDGGRMLRAALWGWRKDYVSATRIASIAGQVFGVLLILLGLWSFIGGGALQGIWLFLIGLFLRGAAGAAYQQMWTTRLLSGERVSRFMTPNPIAVTPETTLQSLVDDYIYRHHHKSFPVVSDGRLVGCVGVREIAAADQADWRIRRVREAMTPCGADRVSGPDEDALAAMTKMSRTRSSQLFVTAGGRLVGVLSLRDLLDFLSLKLEIERPGHTPPQVRPSERVAVGS